MEGMGHLFIPPTLALLPHSSPNLTSFPLFFSALPRTPLFSFFLFTRMRLPPASPLSPLHLQERWKKSEEKVRTFERTRRMSIQKAKEMAAKSPDIPEKILEQIPSEKKAEIVRKLSIRSQRKPVR